MNNFGNIKDTFNEILSKSILNKDNKGKKLFSKYINLLKEDNNLRNEYLIYKNLTSTKFKNETESIYFINENIELLKNNNSKKGIKKLESLLEGIDIVNGDNELYNHINTLRNTKKTPETVIKIQESLKYLSNNMLKKVIVEEENEFDSVDIPPSVLTKLAVNRFNLKYEGISESEKEIIKTILNGNDKDKEEIFNKLKRECIDTIDNELNESSDLDLKDKLLKVKDKLLNTNFNLDNFKKDINKIYDLNESI